LRAEDHNSSQYWRWPATGEVKQTGDYIFVAVEMGSLIIPRRAFTLESDFVAVAPRIRSLQDFARSGASSAESTESADGAIGLEFDLLSKDIEYGIKARYGMTRGWVAFYAAGPILAYIVVAAPQLPGLRFRPEFIASFMILGGLVASVAWGSAALAMRRIRLQEREQWKGLVGTQRLRTNSLGLQLRAKNTDMKLDWSAIRRLSVADGYCRLEIAKDQSILIPARAFPGRDEFAAFVQQLRAYRDAALAG
jgi:hypothetical protein